MTADDCLAALEPDIERHVEIELGTTLSREPAPNRSWSAVRLTCWEHGVTAHIEDALTRKTLTRSFDLSGYASHVRARVIALGVAELLTLSWLELEAASENIRQAERRAPRAAVEARRVVRERVREERHDFRMFALVGARYFWSSTPMLLGIGGAASLRLSRLGLGVEVFAESGERQLALGSAEVSSFGGALMAWYRVQATEVIDAGLGAGARAARGQIVGRSDVREVRGESVAGVWAGPLLTSHVRWLPARWLALELRGEAGYVVAPLIGGVINDDPVAVRGSWLAATLAVGLGS